MEFPPKFFAISPYIPSVIVLLSLVWQVRKADDYLSIYPSHHTQLYNHITIQSHTTNMKLPLYVAICQKTI